MIELSVIQISAYSQYVICLDHAYQIMRRCQMLNKKYNFHVVDSKVLRFAL